MRRAAKVDQFGADTSNGRYKNAGVRICVLCGRSFKAYQPSRLYCGQECYHKARQTLVPIQCARCRKEFKPNTTGRKFCSVECSRPPKKHLEPSRKRGPREGICQQCGSGFKSYPSSNRKFCSYPCFIASGGAQRAGDAAAMAKNKYGAKKDANHNEIFDIISRLVAVKDLSSVGRGVPDGLAWINDGWRLFDVKNPKTGYGRRGLNSRQKKWAEDWRGGPVYLIYTVEEAEQFARGNFDGIKKHEPTIREALEAIGIPFRGEIS